MFYKLLKIAQTLGKEVIICPKNSHDVLRGHIFDLDKSHFAIFHSSPASGGVLWAFRLGDIDSCGLVLETDESLQELLTAAEERSPEADILEVSMAKAPRTRKTASSKQPTRPANPEVPAKKSASPKSATNKSRSKKTNGDS